MNYWKSIKENLVFVVAVLMIFVTLIVSTAGAEIVGNKSVEVSVVSNDSGIFLFKDSGLVFSYAVNLSQNATFNATFNTSVLYLYNQSIYNENTTVIIQNCTTNVSVNYTCDYNASAIIGEIGRMKNFFDEGYNATLTQSLVDREVEESRANLQAFMTETLLKKQQEYELIQNQLDECRVEKSGILVNKTYFDTQLSLANNENKRCENQNYAFVIVIAIVLMLVVLMIYFVVRNPPKTWGLG